MAIPALSEKYFCALQSLTRKYRGLQGNPCNENRDPVMRTGVPCNENRFFPVRIDLQGVPCKSYRVWVCSALKVEILLLSYSNAPLHITKYACDVRVWGLFLVGALCDLTFGTKRPDNAIFGFINILF